MKIKKFKVQNYRSLRDVTLDGLGSLGILIGKNSSGKSNILEAMNLFFSEFAPVGGTTAGLNESFWSRGHRNDPIVFEVEFEASQAELNEIFTQQIAETIGRPAAEGTKNIEIKRKLLDAKGTWRTEQISLGGKAFIENEKFSQTIPTGQALESAAGKIQTVQQITAESQNTVISGLTKAIKGRFRLITITRDGKGSDRFRSTLVDPNVQSRLWTLDQGPGFNPEDEKYAEFESSFNQVTGLQFDPAQGKLMVKKEFRRTPLELEGGGVQTSTNLLTSIIIDSGPGDVIAIEEPENHVHPEMLRNLCKQLEKLSRLQQIIVSAHSPIVVSAFQHAELWLVRLSNSQTEMVKTTDFTNVLAEVGARPSDYLFSDRLVLVEGPSDKIILTAFAEKLQLNLTGIEFLPIKGKNNSSRALELWIGTTRNVIPIYLVLDSDAGAEVGQLLKSQAIKREQIHVWRNGSIEHYYPKPFLEPVLTKLNTTYKLELNVAKIVQEIESGKLQPDRIDLGAKSALIESSWEVAFAKEIAAAIRTGNEPVQTEVEETLIAATSGSY